jgi:hypothetical protein
MSLLRFTWLLRLTRLLRLVARLAMLRHKTRLLVRAFARATVVVMVTTVTLRRRSGLGSERVLRPTAAFRACAHGPALRATFAIAAFASAATTASAAATSPSATALAVATVLAITARTISVGVRSGGSLNCAVTNVVSNRAFALFKTGRLIRARRLITPGALIEAATLIGTGTLLTTAAAVETAACV